MRNAMTAVVFAFTGTLGSLAWADYLAVGPIKGNVCSGFVLEVCGLHSVDAVKGDDGQLYEVTRRFKAVSEYKASSKRCWIKTKTKEWGLISVGINAATQPEFYERNSSGDYEEIDVEYITFECTEIGR